jgi:AhpD family alkylhydroperoxidase
MARIPYVEKEKALPEVAEIYNKIESRGFPVTNVFRMAAHSPSTLGHLIRMGDAILIKTKLNPKFREMAILRTAAMLDCQYEFKAHAKYGKQVGMTDEQVEAIKDWEKSKLFNEAERAVLRFVDEAAQDGRVKDKTFSDLRRFLDEQEMVELDLTIGYYGMLARLLLAFQVDPKERPQSSVEKVLDRSRVQKKS